MSEMVKPTCFDYFVLQLQTSNHMEREPWRRCKPMMKCNSWDSLLMPTEIFLILESQFQTSFLMLFKGCRWHQRFSLVILQRWDFTDLNLVTEISS